MHLIQLQLNWLNVLECAMFTVNNRIYNFIENYGIACSYVAYYDCVLCLVQHSITESDMQSIYKRYLSVFQRQKIIKFNRWKLEMLIFLFYLLHQSKQQLCVFQFNPLSLDKRSNSFFILNTEHWLNCNFNTNLSKFSRFRDEIELNNNIHSHRYHTNV